MVFNLPFGHTLTRCFFLILYVVHQEPPNIEGNAESARVIDLRPWMEYQFQVIASNILGSGEPSMPSHTIRTKQAGQRNSLNPKKKISVYVHIYYLYWYLDKCKLYWIFNNLIK